MYFNPIYRYFSLKLKNYRQEIKTDFRFGVCIRKYIDLDRSKTLACQLILSHLDYANALLTGLPNYEIQKLQSLQYMAARITLDRYWHDNWSENSHRALFDLHWLPVRFRIKHKVLCFVYRCLNKQAPQYLIDLLEPKRTPYSIRQGNNLELVIPKTSTCTGDRAFKVAGPRLWMSIPPKIRLSENFEVFKNALKTYYFREAFPEFIDN